jgi:hypothetical protein
MDNAIASTTFSRFGGLWSWMTSSTTPMSGYFLNSGAGCRPLLNVPGNIASCPPAFLDVHSNYE